jgi:putative DNA primase/helicase
MRDVTDALLTEMRARGFSQKSLNFNGEYQRFPRSDGSGSDSAWFVGRTLTVADRSVVIASYGDWRTDEKYFFRSDRLPEFGAGLSEAELTELENKLQEQKKHEDERREKSHSATAEQAHAIWNSLKPGSGAAHPYLGRKGISAAYSFGTRTRERDPAQDSPGFLYVPLYSFSDGAPGRLKLWNLQRISPDGTKQFMPGGRISGCFLPLSELNPALSPKRIFFAEGIATAATVWEAFEGTAFVVSCFNAGNLPKVVKAFREVFPEAQFVICADEDVFTKRPDGKFYNAGRVKALQAVAEDPALNSLAVFPDLQGLSQEELAQKPTDFNDIAAGAGGLGLVLKSILEQLERGTGYPEPTGLRPGPGTDKPDGNEKHGPSSDPRSSPVQDPAKPEGTPKERDSIEVPIAKSELIGSPESLDELLQEMQMPDRKESNSAETAPLPESASASSEATGGVTQNKNPENNFGLGLAKVDNLSTPMANAPGSKSAQTRAPSGSATWGLPTVFRPIPRKFDEKTKKPIRPSQQEVARALALEYGLNLIKYGQDIFFYCGTHWFLCEDREHDAFFRQIQTLYGPDARSGEVEGALKIFRANIPHVPVGVNLFEPRADRANFQNGTLHLQFRPKTSEEMAREPGAAPYAFNMQFKPHERGDFCTTVLPLEYQPEELLPENEELVRALKRVWPDSDPDQAAKIRLYEELLGAALVPLFAKVVLFQGLPKTGKSTLLLLFAKLVGEGNMSGIDPTKWGESFHLEPMVNKLVNMSTDISTKAKLDDSVLKQIVDRPLMPINRKGRSIVYARLPGLHCFGCNNLPRSIENEAGVYDRRLIVVKTETVQAGNGGGNDYASWLWGRGPEGVLKMALRGLARLLGAGGQYTIPESSKDALREWAEENDTVTQFLRAVREGEIPGPTEAGKQLILTVGDGAEIWKSELHDAYLKWMKDTHPGTYTEKRVGFSKKVTRMGLFRASFYEGRPRWLGVGFVDRGSAKF